MKYWIWINKLVLIPGQAPNLLVLAASREVLNKFFVITRSEISSADESFRLLRSTIKSAIIKA